MVARYIDLVNGTPTENDRPPKDHIAQTRGWVPFDADKWTTDPAYRQALEANYVSQPGDMPKEYEQVPSAFIAATGLRTVFRAIRIRGTMKKSAGGERDVIAYPEGRPRLVGRGIYPKIDSALDVMAMYQKLGQWPAKAHITAIDPYADFLPVRHVAGDDYGTQYISTSVNFERARNCSLTSYATGLPRPRPPYEWAPVVQIDLRQLIDNMAWIVDLRDAPARTRAGFFISGAAQAVGSLASGDEEILIRGIVPDTAIVRVWDAAAVVRARTDAVYQEIVTDDYTRQRVYQNPRLEHLRNLFPAPDAKDDSMDVVMSSSHS